MNISQLLLLERQQGRVVPVPCNGDDAGSDAGVEEWKRCTNMEAACLINDLKAAVKVFGFMFPSSSLSQQSELIKAAFATQWIRSKVVGCV
ncbi:hypothetical protein Nmel_010252 [Mimus melanotis]